MRKSEYDSQKNRNAQLVRDLTKIENNVDRITDELEIVTEKNYISLSEKILAKGDKSYKVDNAALEKNKMEEAQRDVALELERYNNRIDELVAIARKYNLQGSLEDDFVLKTQNKVYELYELVKERPLTSEEYSDLIEAVRQMNFNELAYNYLNLGLTITNDKIVKLQRQSDSKVFMIFKPVITKFGQIFDSFKEEQLEKKFENPESAVKYIEEETKQDSLQYTEYINEVNDKLFKLLLDDDYNDALNKNFSREEVDKLLQRTESLKQKFNEVNLPPSSENGLYSQENLIERDDRWNQYAASLFDTIKSLQAMHIANCYEDVSKYKICETKSGTKVCQIGDKTWPISKEHFVDDIEKFYSFVKEYEDSLKKEEVEGEEKPQLDEVVMDNPVNDVIDEPQAFENQPTAVIKEEDNIMDLSKQAYIEFMSCFVDRDEAKSLATYENITVFETSNVGYTKYVEALNTGKIPSDTSYETFVLEQARKDNGIKYDDPVIQKDDSGLDKIVADEAPVVVDNPQTDLSGFDVSVHDNDPLAFSNDSRKIR